MPRKKKTRRSQAEYPALNPGLNLKTRLESADFDYIDSLPEEWTDPVTGKKYNPKAFLNDFTAEYVHADFNKKKRILKKKKVESEKNIDLRNLLENIVTAINTLRDLVEDSNVAVSSKSKIKKTITKFKSTIRKQIQKEFKYIEDYYKKEAYDRNNSRNRCVLTRAKAQGKSLGLPDLKESYFVDNDVEDQLIEMIDSKRSSDSET